MGGWATVVVCVGVYWDAVEDGFVLDVVYFME